MMEELSASRIAGAVVEGALGYAGGEVLRLALGSAGIDDVAGWIKAAVAELERFFSAKLDEKIVERMATDVEGIQQGLLEYAALEPANRKKNRFLIEHADVTTAAVVPLSLRYQQAYDISLAVMGFRFMALQALYELDADAGHIVSQQSAVDRFIEAAVSSFYEIQTQLDPKTRIKVDVEADGTRIYFDGRVVHTFRGISGRQLREAIAGFTKDFSQECAKTQLAFHREHATMLDNLLRTYQAMCLKVGVTYIGPLVFLPLNPNA
jgi:hypothetical protein